MRADGGIDKIATEAPQACQCALLVRSSEAAVTDNVTDQDCCELSYLSHRASPATGNVAQQSLVLAAEIGSSCRWVSGAHGNPDRAARKRWCTVMFAEAETRFRFLADISGFLSSREALEGQSLGVGIRRRHPL
jgi:hypothetical protein